MNTVSVEVSYIIPSYNHERFIEDCLNSIKSEITSSDEIIVIDDGSVDNTMKIIRNWKANNESIRLQVFEQVNQGICSTLNKLIKLANGKYLRIVSSDDMVIMGSTSKLVKALQNAGTEKLAAFGDAITVDIKGYTISKSHISFLGKNLRLYKKDVLRAIITQWAIVGPSILLRKNFELEVGNYDENLLVEDWNMYLRLASKNNIVFCPEAVALYRVHQSNTSMTKDIKKRVQNLQSQIKGGLANLSRLKPPYLYLLQSEIYLLRAKAYFLQNIYFRTFQCLILYWIKKNHFLGFRFFKSRNNSQL